MKNSHIEHIEDLVFDGKFGNAFYIYGAIVNSLLKPDFDPLLKVSTKFDGAPAIVWGCNTDNGKFFIGTKSVFNKRTPKIAYNHEDIEELYGDKPELAEKLKTAWNSLHSLYQNQQIPMDVLQGDLMFLQKDLKLDGKFLTFQPNTIKYGLMSTSDKAGSYFKADLGIVVHTQYLGSTLAEMVANPFDNGFEGFKYQTRVAFIDPRIDLKHYIITETQHAEVTTTLMYAKQQWDAVEPMMNYSHSKMLKMFVNHCIRIGEPNGDPTMYATFLKNRGEDKLADEVEKQTPVFAMLFSIHQKMIQVKRLILVSLNMSSQFYHEVNGKSCNGEGFVVSYNNYCVKLVDRIEFSRFNFLNNRFDKKAVVK